MLSNYIATKSRIGLANWILLNNKTSKDLNIFGDIGNIKYYLDENIEDDVVYMGRNNSTTQPSIQVFIKTDKNSNIIFDEYIEDDNIQLKMFYSVTEQGFNPEYNFMKINTTDIVDQRYLKLQKIKEIYG
jgi:hypothetical protein